MRRSPNRAASSRAASSRVVPILVALCAGASFATAQAPAAAVTFARAYVAAVAPATDDPDALARDLLAAADRCRTTPYAAYLVQRIQGDRDELQRPAELLPPIDALLATDDAHGLLRSQLRWLRFRLLRATGAADEAARLDPARDAPRSFLCVGPFGRDEDHFAGVPFAPELQPWRDGGTFASGRDTLTPRVATLGAAQTSLDPADPHDPEDGCWYALHRVEAAQDTQCHAVLWSRGGLELFVNGERIAAVDTATGDGSRDHLVPIALARGTNHVLVKTTTADQRAFELAYADGRWLPVPGLVEVPADTPLAPPPAAITATEPPYRDGIGALQQALAAAAPTEANALRIALGFAADAWGRQDPPLEMVQQLEPTTAVERLAAARLWRALDLVPEEIRNARARAFEEAAAQELDDRHWAMLRAAVGLLEEQDRREEALDRLRAAADQGLAGPATFRLWLGVADRARFAAERQPILQRWCDALPNDPKPRVELARDWHRDGATARAAAIGAAAVRMRPDLGEHLGAAWRPALDLGDVATAADLCERVMPAALASGEGVTPLLWRISTAQRDDPARHQALLAELIAHPEVEVRRLRDAGQRALRRGLDDLALQAYERALVLAPDDLATWRTVRRLRGEPEPGAGFERFHHDGDAAIAAFEPGEREDGAPSTMLIDQRIVELFADGSHLIEVHELRRLNDQSGVEEHGEAADASRADEVLLLRTVTADGESFVPVRVSEQYAMPRLEPGVFVEWRYRDHMTAPADGVLRVPEFLFRSMAEHLLLSELVVIHPTGAELDLRHRNLAQEPEVIDLGDGRTALRWTVRDSLRLLPENGMPAMADLAPVVMADADGTIAGALRDHAHWLASAARPTPPIRQQVADLLAAIEDPTEQLRALHAFCQHEITPQRSRSATETLMRKKGDANTLLLAMLRAAGFTLEAARAESIREELITGEGALFYEPQNFYDMRCMRVRKDGMAPTWLFFDTPRYFPAGAVPPERAGGGALVLTDDGIVPTALPASGEHRQHITIEGSGTLSPDQIEVEVVLTLRGADGYHAADHFLRQPANARRQFARQFASQIVSGWQVKKAEIATLEPGQPVSVRATLRRRGPQEDGESLLLPMPLPPTQLLAMAGPRPDREWPMRLTNDLHFAWDLRLTLDGLAPAELPPPTTVQHGPLVYLEEVRRVGATLVLRRRATLGAGTIAVENLGDWLRLLQQVERAEGLGLRLRAR